MFIFFCDNCKSFEAFDSYSGDFKCPNCGQEYLPLGFTIDEWNELTNDEMLQAIENAKKLVADKPVIKQPVFTTSENNTFTQKENLIATDFSSIMFTGDIKKARKKLAFEYISVVLKYDEKKKTSSVYRPNVEDSIMILDRCEKLTFIKDLYHLGGNEQRTTYLCSPLCEAGLM